MAAANFGHFETVKSLTEKGADVNAKDEHGVNHTEPLKRFWPIIFAIFWFFSLIRNDNKRKLRWKKVCILLSTLSEKT